MTAPTRLRILLVDRQLSNQAPLQRQLGGHDLYLAQDYDAAGDILRRKSLDVVVVDHQPDVLRLAARLQPDARRFLYDHDAPQNLPELLEQGVLHQFLPRSQRAALVAQIQALAGNNEPARAQHNESETELRRHRRYNTVSPVDIHCETWGQFIRLYTQDISDGGLFVVNGTPPPIDTVLQIRLRLPDGQLLVLPARVAHIISVERAARESPNPGMGVQFLELDPRQRREIDAIVELAREQSQPISRPPLTRPQRDTPAAKDTGRPASAEEQQLLQRLQDELLTLQEKSDHVVLGLPSSANAAEARTAFFTFSKRYHPDLFARHADPRISRTATEIFVLLKSAYTRLSRSKPGSVPATPATPVRPAPPAGDPVLDTVREHVAAGRLTVARTLLEQMLSDRRDHAEATIWLRLVQARELEQAGNPDQAMARYQEVLALDDQNADAIQSLRVLFDSKRRRS